MQEFKTIIGIVAIILTFIGYVPYLRDVIKGKTIPHVYSWFLWGFVTLIAFAIQVSTGGGIGAFVTLTAAVMCVVVFTLGIKNKAKRQAAVSGAFAPYGGRSQWSVWMSQRKRR